MTGRLFRFTPHAGKPNHYTDSFRSATAAMGLHDRLGLELLAPGEAWMLTDGTWERVA